MHCSSSSTFARCEIVLILVVLAGCGSGKQTAIVTKSDGAEKSAPAQAVAPPSAGVARREAVAPDTFGHGRIEARIKREKWYGDLDGIAKRRVLRVLVTPSKLGFYFNGSQMQGGIYDSVRELEKFLNKELNTGRLGIAAVFIPVAREQLVPMLAEGSGDLVASLVGVNERYQPVVDYTDPLYHRAKFVIVSGPGAPRMSKLDDLSGKQVYYYEHTIPYDKLTELSDAFKKDGKPPIQLTPADPNLQVEDLLEMVNAGLVPMTMAEESVARAWLRVQPRLDIHPGILVAEGPVSWALQKNTPQLRSAVNNFIKGHRIGTAFGNTLTYKYLRSAKWVKDATARDDLHRFDEMVKFFRRYGGRYDFPYLLLAAQAYQESGLNPNLRSKAGAVGVMQIKPSTAAASPIEIPDVRKTDRNVEAGAKYLRFLESQYYAGEPMTPLTRGIFAIASYNAGPNRITKLRTQAAAEGYDPNLWFNNVELIASREIGRETVQYVGNIYKYYLAYKMVTEQDARRQAARQSSASRASK